jgi:tetratricopeptide (TPR) repeat protein
MIMPREDKPKKKPKPASASKPSSPRALMLSIERHLRETGSVGEDTAFEAQQLVYDAWEAETEEQERELIYKALEIDPTNVDALLTFARNCLFTDEEYIETLRKIVARGEKNLGPQTFKEDAGHFWGLLETRPYMRAREELAEALRYAGRLEEAVAEWEAMLELNPNDNQGVRYHLLPCYLALGRLEGARRLFGKYEADCQYNTVFAWGKVLERFLSGDLPGAEAALPVARKQNPHMQAYIKGHRQLPRQMPESYAMGSKEEAVCYAEVLCAAWSEHPAALKWLAGQK